MKPHPHFPESLEGGPTGSPAAFTLAELLVAMSVFLLLLAGILGAHVFGLKMEKTVETKLNASNGARNALSKITDEIRTSSSVWIGNVASNGDFAALMDGVSQTGSGLLIQPTTNAANYIVYFVDPTDSSFRRTTSTPGTTTIVAQTVTNAMVFRAQDYLGNVLTNGQNNRVIHMTLEFYKSQPLLPEPDYFKLETSVTRRAL
jgi:prepilin-type N-terminal cleavage/methylation domain-containing protein